MGGIHAGGTDLSGACGLSAVSPLISGATPGGEFVPRCRSEQVLAARSLLSSQRPSAEKKASGKRPQAFALIYSL